MFELQSSQLGRFRTYCKSKLVCIEEVAIRTTFCCWNKSADSVPTSNLVLIKEVAIRTTFSHMINMAGMIYYTSSLVTAIQFTLYKNAFNRRS